MGQRVLSGDQGTHIYYLQNILRSCSSFSSEMQDGFLKQSLSDLGHLAIGKQVKHGNEQTW
jgi:hypothetical protein